MSALAVLSLFLVSSGLSFPEKDLPAVKPEYLDQLLATEQFELFAKVMNIPDVNLVRPDEDERRENPMLNKELEFGDILPAKGPLKEEFRQGLNFERYTGSKWNGYIPYYIANHYSRSERNTIDEAIKAWNDQVDCVKLWPYSGEDDYVYVMNGNGCWSYLGKIGGQQGLSLQRNGCVWVSTVLHEFQHAVGFAHEQNRYDRDDHIEMLWDNIPEDWKSQYEKTNPRDYGLQREYDYYSIMHYGVKAPGTSKDAFRVKRNGIDNNRIGNGKNFTPTDIAKINSLYC